jgi:hypothetical protein
MPRGLTKKYDHEKGQRRDKAQKTDYREDILDAGPLSDPGGVPRPKFVTIRASSVTISLKPLLSEDKRSLLETLDRHWRFTVNGHVGTISQLLKNPAVRNEVRERRDFIHSSVLRAHEIISTAEHPKTKQLYRLVEFKCCLKPVAPYPNPIFKRFFAFSLVLVGPALTGN